LVAGASQQALTTRALPLPRLMTEAKKMTLAYLLTGGRNSKIGD
jgi:hypothetical protein